MISLFTNKRFALNEMLQNLLHFMYKKTHIVFLFRYECSSKAKLHNIKKIRRVSLYRKDQHYQQHLIQYTLNFVWKKVISWIRELNYYKQNRMIVPNFKNLVYTTNYHSIEWIVWYALICCYQGNFLINCNNQKKESERNRIQFKCFIHFVWSF